jgi:hypothetical protein
MEGRIRTTKIAIPAEYSVLTDVEVFMFLQNILVKELRKKQPQSEDLPGIDSNGSIMTSFEEFKKHFKEHHGFGLQTENKDMYCPTNSAKNIKDCYKV